MKGSQGHKAQTQDSLRRIGVPSKKLKLGKRRARVKNSTIFNLVDKPSCFYLSPGRMFGK
jgi:hypothetical protein